MKIARFFLIVLAFSFLLAACAPKAPAPASMPPAEASATPSQVTLPTAALLTPQAPEGMVFIPAGEFQMGCDPTQNNGFTCPKDELPLRTVTLNAHFIDRYELTNARYDECVHAGGCRPPTVTSSETRENYYTDPAFADYPVVQVSWRDASDYCQWAGKRLPSEAEWEKAARGSRSAAFPWGNDEPSCILVNAYDPFSGQLCVGDTTAVGAHPDGASTFGVEDMAGNVWEWVNDWYSETYYKESPLSNPPGPAGEVQKALRGGSWLSRPVYLRVSGRSFDLNFHGGSDTGFRCAADYVP